MGKGGRIKGQDVNGAIAGRCGQCRFGRMYATRFLLPPPNSFRGTVRLNGAATPRCTSWFAGQLLPAWVEESFQRLLPATTALRSALLRATPRSALLRQALLCSTALEFFYTETGT